MPHGDVSGRRKADERSERRGRADRGRPISAALAPWLQTAEASAWTEMGGFAAGVRRDRAAVDAALTLEWSQGQTEGKVNKVKVTKRVMYGRCKFDLLRLRVLRAG